MRDDFSGLTEPNNTSGASRVAGTTKTNGNHMVTAAAQDKPPANALTVDKLPLSFHSRYSAAIRTASAAMYELPVCVKFKRPFVNMKQAVTKTASQRRFVSNSIKRHKRIVLTSPAIKFTAINRNITLWAGSGPIARLESGWKILNNRSPTGRQSKCPKSQKEFSDRKLAAVGF